MDNNTHFDPHSYRIEKERQRRRILAPTGCDECAACGKCGTSQCERYVAEQAEKVKKECK